MEVDIKMKHAQQRIQFGSKFVTKVNQRRENGNNYWEFSFPSKNNIYLEAWKLSANNLMLPDTPQFTVFPVSKKLDSPSCGFFILITWHSKWKQFSSPILSTGCLILPFFLALTASSHSLSVSTCFPGQLVTCCGCGCGCFWLLVSSLMQATPKTNQKCCITLNAGSHFSKSEIRYFDPTN